MQSTLLWTQTKLAIFKNVEHFKNVEFEKILSLQMLILLVVISTYSHQPPNKIYIYRERPEYIQLLYRRSLIT